jgi:CheY-specific phosphatase CheX
MQAQVDEQTLINASVHFWEQMLAMALAPLPDPSEFCAGSGHVLGSVGLSGNWTGRVEVRMAEPLAHAATAAMLMQPEDSLAEADTLDATREIANMIAGAIKSSLPRPCAMTVPEAAVEREGFCTPEETADSLIVVFRLEAGDLMVRVWEQECIA